ncbi:MAG: TonB-dependent receptor domain-containing protein, partial [Bacteroidota bacterium]
MKNIFIRLTLSLIAFVFAVSANAQVTSASFTGTVKDGEGQKLKGAVVKAIHEPSGSVFTGTSTNNGYYSIPGIRIGGPYKVSVSYGDFNSVDVNDIYVALGQDFVLDMVAVSKSSAIGAVTINVQKSKILNSQNTGASTNINQEALSPLPTLSRNLNDFMRLTPQSRSSSVASTTGNGVSFSGQDSRFNNLTIDGSIFNNSFGLASAPAGQTASTPISLDAIQEIQVNLAPYDVRLGGFTGAGINAVTRSGTNKIEGSAFVNTRNNKMVGKKAGDIDVKTDEYNVQQMGFRLGGPLIKNKLFFFVNAEEERRDDPGTQFKANRGEPSGTANVTRVRASALDSLRDFLKTNYNYDAGEYDGYKRETYSFKYLVKLDWNINDKNKFSLRYNSLVSRRDVLASNSGVFSGNRNGTVNALNFSNNNYIINNNLNSIIAELNSNLNKKLYSSFQIGYTANRDFRGSGGGIFPLVDIMEGGQTYTSFGYEPFTPNNILNTNTLQIQENLTYYKGKHVVNAGFNLEHFAFENTFTPTYYGQYVYKSLSDFYKSAAGDTSVQLARYALTYSAVEGGALPTASPKVTQLGAYIQDNFNVNSRLKITAGVRIDIPSYASESEYWNKRVDTMKFNGPEGKTSYSTKTLPTPNPLVSPRVGFNWNAKGNRDIQVRGGSGLFAGRPAFVWISNQLSNNGVTTG